MLGKCDYLKDIVPRLGRPTRRATWSDLKDTLSGGSVDRLTGAAGGIFWQLVVALLFKDSWETGHIAEILDCFRRGTCKALAMGVSRVPTLEASRYFILSPFDDVDPQRVVGDCVQQRLYSPLYQSDERTPLPRFNATSVFTSFFEPLDLF